MGQFDILVCPSVSRRFFVASFLCCILSVFYSFEHNHHHFKGHSDFPKTVFFSIYMGNLKYTHLPLLLESMRHNPNVNFTLIHVNVHVNMSDSIIEMGRNLSVANFFVKPISISDFSEVVKDRLGISVPFTPDWAYKLCDYKPTLAHLFPELAQNTTYKFWGYGDIDVVWGNFSHFQHWFNGDYHFIISGWWGTTGAAAFYPNRNWTKRLFMQDPKYVPLLRDLGYHNLDEGGTQTNPEWVVDNGDHSISEIQKRVLDHHNLKMNRAEIWQDHCFIDPGDSGDWAGPVEWKDGNLKIIKASEHFPAGRQLLFYHRIAPIEFPPELKQELFREMAVHGFLLPSWRPLVTRFACDEPTLSLEAFKPTTSCLHSNNTARY